MIKQRPLVTSAYDHIDITAPGVVAAVLAFHRARFGDARMGPEDDAPDGDDQGEGEPATGETSPASERGFPDHTPVAEMSDREAAAYWKHQSRKHESRSRERSDYDDVKAKAAKYDEQVAANATDLERAVAAAREEGRQGALDQANASVVTAHLRAGLSARGRSAEDVAAVIASTNVGAFITDGDVDTGAVAEHVARIAGPVQATRVDLGQGSRTGATPSGMAAGRAAYEATRAKRTA